MNIFVLDDNPVTNARMHCDRHVVKMILESAQMICTTHHLCPNTNESYSIPYKMTHKNHPCNKWLRDSIGNYSWLVELTKALNTEYRYRYNRDVNHKSYDAICQIDAIKLHSLMPKGFTPHPQCMPDKYKNQNPVIAYRNYYKGEKEYFAKWRLITPEWW